MSRTPKYYPVMFGKYYEIINGEISKEPFDLISHLRTQGIILYEENNCMHDELIK